MLDLKNDVETPDIKAWKEEARRLQQNLFLRLRDREWDEWDRSYIAILYRKIGFDLYPLPKNQIAQYSDKEIEKIKRIANVIIAKAENDSVINFACIYIFGKIDDGRFFIPVFKVKKNSNQTLFVDSDCHIYEKWQDYLNSNHLPKCLFCYPLDGLYQGDENHVMIDYDTSPASIDDTATVVTFATSVMMAAIFTVPIATPILEVVQEISNTGVCNITESIANSVNSQLHDQRVDRSDLIEKMDIEGITALALDIARSRFRASIIQAAAAGKVEIEIENQELTQPLNAVVADKSLFLLMGKKDDGTLNSLYVTHFSVTFNFPCINILPHNEVQEIFKKTQQEILNHHCDDLTAPQIEELFRLSDQVQGETLLHKNANKIKAINHIIDKQAFYESLVTARRDLEGHQVQFSFEELGLINIDNELHIAPNKLVEISDEDRQAILDATLRVNDSTMNDSAYWRRIETILKKNRVQLQYNRRTAVKLWEKVFHTDNLEAVKIGNEQIFKNMISSELDRIAIVIKSVKNHDILKIAIEFSKMRECKTVRDFCNYVEYTAEYVNGLRRAKENNYLKSLFDAKCNKDFKQQIFDCNYGIKGKRTDHFINQVTNDFAINPKESFEALEKLYTDLEKDVRPLNENTAPNFASIVSAVTHYFKHSVFGSTKLTAKEYFNTASELVNEPLNRCLTILNQQGDRTIITFTNPINGAKGVVFETLPCGTLHLATLYYDDKVLSQSN